MKPILSILQDGGDIAFRDIHKRHIALIIGHGDGFMTAWMSGNGLTSEHMKVTVANVQQLTKWIAGNL